MMENNINIQNMEESSLKKIMSGTTTVGIIVKDGVIIGTEII